MYPRCLRQLYSQNSILISKFHLYRIGNLGKKLYCHFFSLHVARILFRTLLLALPLKKIKTNMNIIQFSSSPSDYHIRKDIRPLNLYDCKLCRLDCRNLIQHLSKLPTPACVLFFVFVFFTIRHLTENCRDAFIGDFESACRYRSDRVHQVQRDVRRQH